MNPRFLLASCILLILASPRIAAEQSRGPLPIHHLRAVDGNGEDAGEYLVVHDNDATPPAILGLLQAKDGYRAELRSTLDRAEGVATQRFLDLHSGWWVERRHDLGLRTLGGPEDFHDAMEWLVAVRERHERERPTATYSLTTSDGAHVEWTKAWDASEGDTDKRRTDALAAFATALADTEPPPSALAELHFMKALIGSPQGGKVSAFEDLVTETTRAARAARSSDNTSEVDIKFDLAVSGERVNDVQRLMTMLDEHDQDPQEPTSPKQTPTRNDNGGREHHSPHSKE